MRGMPDIGGALNAAGDQISAGARQRLPTVDPTSILQRRPF